MKVVLVFSAVILAASAVGNFELLSRGKRASQSSTGWGGKAQYAVDGKTDGVYNHKSVCHSGSPKNNWWKVDLGRNYAINLVVVYNRKDCCQGRINGAEVYAGNHKCGTISGTKLFYTISCGGVSANNVRVIQKNNWLHMAEVQVFGGSKGVSGVALLSQGKPTAQNNVAWGGVPGRAVDGNVDGVFSHATSTHTKTNRNNWWKVDLQAKKAVYLVVVHNRVDCCQNRINGAQVFVDNQLCGTIKYNGQSVYPINCEGKLGRSVMVKLASNYLTLAEVQVFGTNPPVKRAGTDRLTIKAGQTMIWPLGDGLTSSNGQTTAIMQRDGNFVVYCNKGRIPIFATNTDRKAVQNGLYMQNDGNLVLYGRNRRVLWASGTNARNGYTFVMQNDNNLVLYAGGKALWSSKSSGQCAFMNALQKRGNTYLSGYSRGKHFFNNLYQASYACARNSDCGGITYEKNNRRYSLRRGKTFHRSPSGETSWLRGKVRKVYHMRFTKAVRMVYRQFVTGHTARGACPASHPYVYYNGQYCCQYNREKYYAPQGWKCDGSTISRSSMCCHGDRFKKCPSGYCTNHRHYSLEMTGAGWSQIPGRLMHISNGKSGTWGVASNGHIYRLNKNGRTWTYVPGILRQVYSGDKVWGINDKDEIWRWYGGANWQRMPGHLRNLDVSDNGNVWGASSDGKLWRWTGKGWQNIAGRGIIVTTGRAGVWHVNSAGNIYYRKGTYGDGNTAGHGWTHVPGNLRWISSGNEYVIGINKNDEIYYRKGMGCETPTGTSWVHVPGKLMQIEVNGHSVVGVTQEQTIMRNDNLLPRSFHYHHQRAIFGHWSGISGRLMHVSNGKSGIWGVSKNGWIWRWQSYRWIRVSGVLRSVSSGARVWGINDLDQIWLWEGGNRWRRMPGALRNLDVSDAGHVWGTSADQKIWRWTGRTWQEIDGRAVIASVGRSGVWVVTQGGFIYYRNHTFGDRNTAGHGWTKVPGNLRWISSGKDFVVGVTKNDEIFYRKGVSCDNPTGTEWVRVPGKLMQIEVNGNQVVGVNEAFAIFKTPVH